MNESSNTMDKSENRRQYPRAATNIQAKLSVLIPEDTFSPASLECTVLDLSERGAMVRVLVDSNFYRQLMQKSRLCRIAFGAGQDLPSRLVGKAVWLQPEKSENAVTTLKVGLFFEECPDEAVRQLRDFVKSRLSGQPQPA